MTARTAILIASLAVNLFLGGFLISNIVANPPPAGALGAGVLREAAAALPADRQAALLADFGTHRREFRRLRLAQLAAAWEVRNAFIAQPYDPDRVAAAFADLRETTAAWQALVHDTLTQAAADLTPDQRQAFLQAVVRGMRGRGQGQGQGQGGQGHGAAGGGPWR